MSDTRFSIRPSGGLSRGRSPGGVLSVLLLFVPLTACATKGDIRDLREELAESSARQETLLRELQRQNEAQRDSIQAISQALQSHEARIAGQFRGLEDLVLRTEELAGITQQELAAIRDRQGRPGGADPVRMDEAAGGSAEDGYGQAVALMRRGSMTAARMGFQGVIESFPNHPLAPEARYHLADILVQEDRPEEAAEAFARIAELHPEAERVPDALYRAGVIHRELGNTGEARRYLERVVNTWPESGAADLARQVLREMGQS
jgi:tol-pal system protein YbgF